MSDKLFNKFQKVLEMKLETIKDEVHSAIENLKVEFEAELDEILAEFENEEKVNNSFKIDLATLTKIINKGKVTKLEGAVASIAYSFQTTPERLFLNDRGVIRPPFNTFDYSNEFEILEIELTLPSGKVLNTQEVKELFVD